MGKRPLPVRLMRVMLITHAGQCLLNVRDDRDGLRGEALARLVASIRGVGEAHDLVQIKLGSNVVVALDHPEHRLSIVFVADGDLLESVRWLAHCIFHVAEQTTSLRQAVDEALAESERRMVEYSVQHELQHEASTREPITMEELHEMEPFVSHIVQHFQPSPRSLPVPELTSDLTLVALVLFAPSNARVLLERMAKEGHRCVAFVGARSEYTWQYVTQRAVELSAKGLPLGGGAWGHDEELLVTARMGAHGDTLQVAVQRVVLSGTELCLGAYYTALEAAVLPVASATPALAALDAPIAGPAPLAAIPSPLDGLQARANYEPPSPFSARVGTDAIPEEISRLLRQAGEALAHDLESYRKGRS